MLWQERLQGGYSASPVAAAGHVYLVNEDGATTVVQAGDEPHVVSRNLLDEPTLASLALADGAIFLRTDRRVFCFAEKGSCSTNRRGRSPTACDCLGVRAVRSR